MLSLYLREQGESGPVVLLLHGLFGSSANWGSVARDLGTRYRVLVPDLRNHGQSPHHADVSYTAMAEDLLGLLDEQFVRKAILVGHSMGGKLAMQLALQYPDRVAGVAVVDMAPLAYPHSFDQVFNAFDAVDLSRLIKRTDADEPMAEFIPQRGVRAFLQQNLQRSGGAWEWRCNLDALRAGQAAITGFEAADNALYPGPASFIYGALSDYVLPEYEVPIRRYFPAASLCRVEDAGHWLYAENPGGFAKCLASFLERI